MSENYNKIVHHLQAMNSSCVDSRTINTTTNRLNNYKNHARNMEDFKKRQNESTFEIRKQNKDIHVLKRRVLSTKEEEFDLTSKK